MFGSSCSIASSIVSPFGCHASPAAPRTSSPCSFVGLSAFTTRALADPFRLIDVYSIQSPSGDHAGKMCLSSSSGLILLIC